MMILGLMGAIGCGKGTVADYLVANYGFKTITMGDMVREEVMKRGLEITREGTTKVSEECRKKDPLYFMNQAINKIKNSEHNKWIIDGIRQPIDVEALKKAFPKIELILVDVSAKERYERMKSRGRADMPKTYEEFLAQEKLENEKFHLNETFKKSTIKLTNEGNQKELQNKINLLMNKLKITN